ncbi:MAG: PTS sugar transporter subunit IIA [Spirochaetaceae bacterium]|jgi:mannitol/fructose-specific phosphotransferase system IIA component (Ntr-type)/CBS domain-containing protein|nr:PTS sugar transporter subunit IIA [Spirochaetaceae bacterium]
MKLSSLLNPELVRIKASGKTKDELIDELIREIYRTRQYILLSEQKVREAVLEREQLGGTVFPNGLATPHARLEGFSDLLIAVAIPAQPVQYENTVIRMMILILTSQGASTLYLNTLSAFAKLSKDAEQFDRLCAAASSQGFVQVIKDCNIDVMQTLLVGSIMHQNFMSLSPEHTIKEAADMFYKNRLSYLPVVDSAGEFAGELTVLDLFAVGIPDYALKLENLQFLRRLEPFEELLKKEHDIRVRQVMKPVTLTIKEDAPVVEGIMQFIRSNRRHIPVVKQGKLTGIVGYMDILHKVLRA